MKLADKKIYLASKSPRRRELLRQIGIDFELLLTDKEVDEQVLPNEAPADYVARVTRDKLLSARQTMLHRQLLARPILAADTTVVVDELILGKPADFNEAVAMITRLSGRTHQVLTSIAVAWQEQMWQITQYSDVAFDTLNEETIRSYCATQEPYDKAGGYGIQGLASMFIKEIAGSHSGIMGLPLYETTQLLQKAGLRMLPPTTL
ncbi:septum formation protein [Herbaspirillum sp. Sphag1AN]|uniref:Maf family protein n=1 Tax=unclassified Herbaspirillum TaxID=2624150 RepID=UPI00160E4B14|nr:MULTISPECIES: Maf family protein [unclassified Herbaspirillum]MBB3214116.1 septum formation protein [Herbaspirillum sp. Sphag1AN]MBB3247797.1 septum formation protein [Herbaspirillum sp. Sphag64]